MRDAFVDIARKLKDGSRPPLLPGLLPPGLVAARRRSREPLPASLGRIGPLEVRLARDASEIRGAQSLRYRVFHEEMSATPRATAWLTRRDTDAYDLVCDHLLVLDHSITEPRPFGAPRPKIVGTYRLLRQEVADLARGFYSQDEFELDALVARHPNARFLELGRSCVLPRYRDKRTVELLWHGIWTYVLAHGIDVMVGCASFEGIDPDQHAEALTFLAREARAEGEWAVRAQPRRSVAMDRLAPGARLDAKRALVAMPPLLKGYLRLGARFGDGAVIDRRFGTTDVFVVLPRSAISERYIAYFGADASRHAA